jgi:hypothetical protein
MAPVSLTWGTIEDETRVPAGFDSGASADKPAGPYALADVLSEIVSRYAPRPPREQRVSVGWLTMQSGIVSIPVLQR